MWRFRMRTTRSVAVEDGFELDLDLGDGEAAYLASDLSTDYVKLNAEYTT